MVPLPLIRGDEIVTPAELLNVLSTSRRLHLVGSSDNGKSHLAKHAVLGLPEEFWLPIFVDAGLYEGRLSVLLNRSVARFVTQTADDVIRAASHSIRSGGPPAMAPGDRSACDHRRVPPRNLFNAPGASRRPLARWFLLPISLTASAAATQKNGTVGTT